MTFNPHRLSIARKRRMLNKKGFADLIGVTSHTVVRWEKGETEPSEENVRSFSQALRFPAEFFFLRDIEEPEHANFRSYTTMSAATRDAALAAGSIGFLVADWIDGRFNLPPSDLPDLSDYSPDTAASALRRHWGLGEKPISHMIKLLEAKGIRVFSLAENTAKVNAYSLWRDGKPYVFLNTMKSAESSRFDAAHELGHLVLHQDSNAATSREAEDQANAFASEFLMPKSDVLGVLPASHDIRYLIRAKARWRVSLAALCYRLNKLGLVSDWRYRDLCIEMSTRGYHRSEPEPIERETSIVWQKILQSLWLERMTLASVASELRIPEAELNDLVFGILQNSQVQAGAASKPTLARRSPT